MTPYISIEDAEDYFALQLNTGAWDSASSVNKAKALTHATLIIDRLDIAGTKTDSEQELQFPRDPDTSVPIDVQKACAEIAKALLDEVDPEKELEDLRIQSSNFGVQVSKFEHFPEHLVAGVPSSVAWQLLRQYLNDPCKIKIERIS